MKQISVDVYLHESNFAVLRMPTRRFPGVLIQGDSLSALCSLSRAIQGALDVGDPETARDVANELDGELRWRLNGYISTLDSAGMRLPFTRPRATEERTTPDDPER